MNIDYFLIGFMLVLIVAQNIFWARYCLMLTNRIMSRNYAEVVQVERQNKVVPPRVDKSEEVIDPEDQRQAMNLNSMFGMV